jgi:cyclin D7
MEDLDHSFQPITIQRMELVLLRALGWRLGSTTAYSYVELLMMEIDFLKSYSYLQKDLVACRVTELLLGAMQGTCGCPHASPLTDRDDATGITKRCLLKLNI